MSFLLLQLSLLAVMSSQTVATQETVRREELNELQASVRQLQSDVAELKALHQQTQGIEN